MVSYGMSFRTLISTSALALHLDDPAFAIVDCRYKLDDATWGEREHEAERQCGKAAEPEDIILGDRGLQAIGVVWLVLVSLGVLGG